MKTVKIIQILLLTMFSLSGCLIAQSGLTLDLGGGIGLAQNEAYVNKSTSYGGRLYVPITRKGWDGRIKKGISLGLLATFSVVNPQSISDDVAPIGLNVGGTGVTTNTLRGWPPGKPGWKNGIGLQVNWHAGAFVASPFITVGQDKQGANGTEVVQEVTFNGKTDRYILRSASRPETKVLAFTPGLRIGYRFSKYIGLWASCHYTTGGEMVTNNTQYIPNGSPDQNGNYTVMQLQQGQVRPAESTVTPYKNLGFSGGLSFSFGGKPKGAGNSAGIKPGDNCKCCFKSHKWKSESECCAENGGVSKPSDQKAEAFELTWDGTLGGIFTDATPNIFLPTNGGIDQLVATINKGGKGKAKKSVVNGTNYVVIEQVAKDSTTFSYFEIPTGNPSCIPVPDEPSITCRNRNCSNCGPVTDVTGILRCKCFSGGEKLCFDVSIKPNLNDFLSGLLVADVPILVGEDGTLTQSSVNTITDLVVAQMPNAQVKGPKLVTEKKLSYLIVPVVSGKKSFTLVSQVLGTGAHLTVSNGIWSVAMYCEGGTCGTGTNCFSVAPAYESGVISCPCGPHPTNPCKPTFGKMVGWQKD